MAKLSAFDDQNKSTKKKKQKPKKVLTKAVGTSESSSLISDVGQVEGSSKSDVAGPSQPSSEEPSAPQTDAPPTIEEQFLDFLMQ